MFLCTNFHAIHSLNLQLFNVPSNKVDQIDKVDNAVMTESSNLLTR